LLSFISPKEFLSLALEAASHSGMTRPILEMECGPCGRGENLAGAEIVGRGEPERKPKTGRPEGAGVMR
jgi:hypothetical protein